MTVNRGPGVSVNAGVGTTTLEHRLQLAGQYAENAPGVPRSGVLAQAAAVLVTGKATMAYDIGPAAVVISRTAGEGVYTPTLTGTTTVTTSAAPASGSRWDLVWIKQNDVAKGDADNLAVVGVTSGTSGATPTKPTASVPTGAYVLAEAQIFSGTTGTSGGSNTLTQVWRHTAARGGIIPVRNVGELAEITVPARGMAASRLDLPEAPVAIFDGTNWSLLPLGELGSFTLSGTAATGSAVNNPAEFNVPIEANRRVRIRATVRGQSSVAGAVIAYWVRYGGTGTTGTVAGDKHHKSFAQTATEESAEFSGTFTNTAAASVRISLVAQVVAQTSAIVSFPVGGIVLSVDDLGPA